MYFRVIDVSNTIDKIHPNKCTDSYNKMEAERQDGFMQELISRETKEAITELKDIIDNGNNITDYDRGSIQRLLTLYLQTSANIDEIYINNSNNSFISGHDIFNIIRYILKHKLDFGNRLCGKRNILEQWQKTRASKNEEFSIKFRESGNDCLRTGQLKMALHFYNEALLYCMFFAYSNDNVIGRNNYKIVKLIYFCIIIIILRNIYILA